MPCLPVIPACISSYYSQNMSILSFMSYLCCALSHFSFVNLTASDTPGLPDVVPRRNTFNFGPGGSETRANARLLTGNTMIFTKDVTWTGLLGESHLVEPGRGVVPQ